MKELLSIGIALLFGGAVALIAFGFLEWWWSRDD